MPLLSRRVSRTIENYMEHFLSLIDSGSLRGDYRQALPWILWGIWKQSNGKVYAKNAHDVDILVAQPLEEAEEWRMANEEEYTTVQSPAIQFVIGKKWYKPQVGIMKCKVKVSWINASQLCGRSWILRDHSGKVRLHARDAFLSAQNMIVLEIRGILWVLQNLYDIHCDKVEVWTECGAAVKAINNWIVFKNLDSGSVCAM